MTNAEALRAAEDAVTSCTAMLDALIWRQKVEAEEMARRVAEAEENVARVELHLAELRGEMHAAHCVCNACFSRKMEGR